jgi:hypothetical protein
MREADQVLSLLWAGYSVWDPKWIYKRYSINADFYGVTNFGGDWTGGGFEWNASMNLKNFWYIWTGGSFNTPSISTGMLRGGPMMRTPGSTSSRIGISTDSRKKIVFELYENQSRGYEKYSHSFYTSLSVTYKPINALVLTLSPGYSKSSSELQYVSAEEYKNNDRYIFASINRKTISTSFRVSLNLSPDLTFQYWGQPFIATGSYYDHKYIVDPMAKSFPDRFRIFSPNQISPDGDSYNIDENIDGITDYTFDRRDFNVQEFLSNFVVRWEYNPGSAVFLVWSQTRSGSNSTGNLDLFNDLGDLFNGGEITPHNVFLIKFSYRFGIR